MRIIFILVSCIGLMCSCSTSKKTKTNEGQAQEPITEIKGLPPHTKTKIEGQFSQVQGKVLDSDGQGLAFANVVLLQSNTVRFGSSTNENGEFKITSIPMGEYTISISFVGYQTQNFGPLRLDAAYDIQFSMIESPPIEIILLKPLIYLYPMDTIDVHVQLQYKGDLIHTYPRISQEGWSVTALPNGTLIDAKNRSYYGLYWEGDQDYAVVPSTGEVVAGAQSIEFLEKSLDLLGLTEREANEFIMYWLPQMEKNPYNLIHFATTEYAKETPLIVTPKPDDSIRILMTLIPLQAPISFPQQIIQPQSNLRVGFTVVEWGGQILPISILNQKQP